MCKGTPKWSLEDTLYMLFGGEASFIVNEIRREGKGDPIDFYRNRDSMRSFASSFVKLYENKHDQYLGSDYLLEKNLKVSYFPLAITSWFRKAQILEDLFHSSKPPESIRAKIDSLKEMTAKDFDEISFEDFAKADFWRKTEFFILLFGGNYSNVFFPKFFQTIEPSGEKLFLELENYLSGAIAAGEIVPTEFSAPPLLSEQYLFEDDGFSYRPSQLVGMLQRKSYPVPQELLASLENGEIAKSSKLLKKLRRNMTCLLVEEESSRDASTPTHLNDETAESDQELSAQGILFNKEGQVWRVGVKGEPFVLIKDIDGMSYIDHLLKNPDKTISCLNLYYAIKGHPGELRANNPYSKMTQDQLEEHNLPTIVGFEEADNVIRADDLAKTLEALNILKEQHEELEGAEDTQSQVDQKGIAYQIENIEKQLRRDTNRQGKSRILPPSLDNERARSNVSKAIRSAIKNIESHSPRLGKYLIETIQMGSEVRYLPPSID